MEVEIKVNVDLQDIFESLPIGEQYKFCDIVLEFLDDGELIDALKQRHCDWSDYGLKEE